MSGEDKSTSPEKMWLMNRFRIPFAVFVLVVALLGIGLRNDPTLVPSPIIGKRVPEFALPKLRSPDQYLRSTDFGGEVILVNVWATWCIGCRQEHRTLLSIAQGGEVPIYGLNYKDTRIDAIRWLDQLGDPYVSTGFDGSGRVGIDFGVYGAPETYVVGADGKIAYKHIGPVTDETWRQTLRPLVRRLMTSAG